jgi:hypothetical protein
MVEHIYYLKAAPRYDNLFEIKNIFLLLVFFKVLYIHIVRL